MSDQHIHPLGLPSGSVRAILALVVVSVACQQMLNKGHPSLLLAETLMIVLTYYFTTRRHVQIDTEIYAKLKSEVAVPVEESPLWLPKGSVRGLIAAAFSITVIMLIGQGRLLDSNVLTLLGPFAAYMFGALLRSKNPQQSAQPGWFAKLFAHMLALLVILIGCVLLLLTFYNLLPTLPDWVASLLLSAILYYFGTR